MRKEKKDLIERAIDKALKDYQKMQEKCDTMKADVEELYAIRDRITGQLTIDTKGEKK